MSTIALTQELYFTTSTVVDWLDVFTRPIYKHIILDSLVYCQEHKGLDIYAWVLMSNHLHMIIGTRDDHRIGDVMRDFKKYTSKKIVAAIIDNERESRKEWLLNRLSFRSANNKKIVGFKFWQDDNHIESLYSFDFFKQKLDYVHLNPVRQEIVERPEEYWYSSARNYAGEAGLLDVIVVR